MDYEQSALELLQLVADMPGNPNFPMRQIVPQGELKMLACLAIHGPTMSSGDLARRLGLSSGRTSIVIASLEKKGYIVRERTEQDQRRVAVQLAPKGQGVLDKLKGQAVICGGMFLRSLGEEDALDFIRLVKKIHSLSQAFFAQQDPLGGKHHA